MHRNTLVLYFPSCFFFAWLNDIEKYAHIWIGPVWPVPNWGIKGSMYHRLYCLQTEIILILLLALH